MWLEIAARRIIMPFVFSVILYFWGPFAAFVRPFTLLSSEGSFIALASMCCIQLFVVLAVWESLIFRLFVRLRCRIDEMGRNAVRKRNASLAISSIRLNHALLRVQRILRQGWVSSGRNRANPVWSSLNSWSVRSMFGWVVKVMFSAPVCFAVLCASLMMRSIDSRVDRVYDGVLSFLCGFLSAGDVIQAVVAHMPAIIALMPLMSLPAFLYFYSQKRNVRRAIGRNKTAHVNEVALLYERLLLWIDRNLYSLCLNFQYVVTVQRSLVDFQLKHIFPERLSKLQVHRLWRGVDELDRYMFVELDDAQECSEIVDELLGDKLKRYTRIFSAVSDDIWEFYFNDLYKLKSVEGVQEAFLCKDAVKLLVGDRISREQMRELGVDRISEVRDELEDWLSCEIYSGLEMLYRIKKASRALRRYLYSSRTETLILKALSRDK